MKQDKTRYQFRANNLILAFALLFSESFAQYTWVDSTDSSGNVIRMKVNNKTGAPHRLHGLGVNFNNRYGEHYRAKRTGA